MSKRTLTYWLIAIAVVMLSILDDSPLRYVKLVVRLGLLLAVVIPAKLWQRILVVVATLFCAFLLVGRQVTLSIRTDAAVAPFWSMEAPAEQVLLGGQRIFFPSVGLVGTACFAPGNGTLVVLAHSTEQIAVGQSLAMSIHDQQNVISCQAKVLISSEQGVVLGLPQDVSIQADLVSLGGTVDVRVGEQATVRSTVGGSYQVMVDGYIQKDDQQLLVLTPMQLGDRVVRGMSGSPVIQNGKLIGLLFASVETVLQPGNFGLAKLAVDVLAASQSSSDWDGDVAPAPLTDAAIDSELTAAAHRSLVEKHELDLTRFAPLDYLDRSTLPSGGYTPAFSDDQLQQICLQDAQREYAHLSSFPPLVLFSERENVLLVGYLLMDEQAVLVRYRIQGGGWQKSSVTK